MADEATVPPEVVAVAMTELHERSPISLLSSDSNAQMGWESFKSAVAMLSMFDWAELQAQMNRAHSIGHILDPTGYRSLIHNPHVARNLQLAGAAAEFLRKVRAITQEPPR